MRQSIYLAIKYLWYHHVRTFVLIIAVGIILYLPVGLQHLINKSEKQLMVRANDTPLLVGSKGNTTDLVINSLYFEQGKIEPLKLSIVESLNETGFGYSIPIISTFSARNFPIVGTNLDYLNFRKLSVAEGRTLRYVGECLLGSNVAEKLDFGPGDSLVSSPENFFDLAGVYPLQMKIAGVLAKSNTPDDNAVFTDLKTNWIIMGLGHGHQDMQNVKDPTLVISRDSSNVTASAKLFIYNQISGKDPGSYHFHGNMNNFPLTSVLFVPNDQKASTLLQGRFESGEMKEQVIVPTEVVENLLQSIFRIKKIFNTVFMLVGLATLFILVLLVLLTLKLRKEELFTMYTIGSSKNKIIEIVSSELLIVILISVILASLLYGVTGFFVDYFIQKFII